MATFPQRTTVLLVDLKWALAEKELKAEDDEVLDYIEREFWALHGLAREEEEKARRFNDTELFKALGLLYTARLLQQKDNIDALLAEAQGAIKEKDVMELVSAADLCALSMPLPAAISSTLEWILDSEYFTQEPKRYVPENESLSPTLKFLREHIRAPSKAPDGKAEACVVAHFKELENLIVSIYKLEDLGPRRHLSGLETYSDEQFFKPLARNKDLDRLLSAARSNEFLYDLISSKPPNCAHISHEQALLECGEHARLWLLEAEVPVYYNFPLRYCDIAKTTDGMTSIEMEARSSPVGFGAELLSTTEKTIRRETIACYSQRDEDGLDFCNLAPEDFDGIDKQEVSLVKFLGGVAPLPEGKSRRAAAAEWDAKWHDNLLEGSDPAAKLTALKAYAEQFEKEKEKERLKHTTTVGREAFLEVDRGSPFIPRPKKQRRTTRELYGDGPTRKSPRLQSISNFSDQVLAQDTFQALAQTQITHLQA